jgi:hypothetical protein
VTVLDPAHPLFDGAFRVVRMVHRGGNHPIGYEVEYRDGASLLIQVAATGHRCEKRTE